MEEIAGKVVRNAVRSVFLEVVEGAAADRGWLLNPGDPGLLASLDRISAADASATPSTGGAPVAAHVEHLRYGLSLLNRARRGESPYDEADWSVAWRTTAVTDTEWRRLKEELRLEARQWLAYSEDLTDTGTMELTVILANVAHLAYHLGAIRQISPATGGPKASG